MYIPPHFAEVSHEEITSIIETAPLACLVAQTVEGLIANHLPVVIAKENELIGHMALANDMHRLVAEGQDVLVIFRSDDAYISANYYPTKQEHHRHVPTWNYQVVHIYGTISFQHDEKAKRAAVGLLTRHHEQRVNGPNGWRMSDAPADYMEKRLQDIVAFRIAPKRTLAKSKLSQNREEVDYRGALSALETTGHRRMADKMKQRLGALFGHK